jgi:hypothetical protein
VSVDCRFFKDDPTTAKIVWYPAADGAPCLPYPSKFRPRSQAYFGWIDTDIGEVAGAPARLNHKKTPPFVAGQHVCGTAEDFSSGAVYNPALPPVQYDKNGIPICCQPAVVGAGGFGATGTADFSVTPPSYSTVYFCGGTPVPAFEMDQTIANQEWVSAPLPTVYTLRSPLYPGNTGWTLTAVSLLTSCSWATAATWNGLGVRAFALVSGGCTNPFYVQP